MSVCWEIKPGKMYKCASLTLIFVGSSALVVILLCVNGVEYTFGRISYITPGVDRATFWGPLLGISAASLLLQFATVAYCAIITLRPWYNYQRLRWSGYTPSRDEERVLGAQRTASRVRKVVQIQWRNNLITIIILIYVCFSAGVLMQLRPFHDYAKSDRMAWFECLRSSNGDRDSCLSLARSLGPSEPVLVAVLSMLVVSYPSISTRSLACFLTTVDLAERDCSHCPIFPAINVSSLEESNNWRRATLSDAQ